MTMQTAQPLSTGPIRPMAQTDQREQTTPTDDTSSFRSKMERAERKTAVEEKPWQSGETTSDSEQRTAVEEKPLQSGETTSDSEEDTAVIKEQAWAGRLEVDALQEGTKTMERSLPLVQTEEKQPGEETPAEYEAQMAILAALLTQPGSENQAALSAQTEHVAAEGQAPIMTAQIPQTEKKVEEPVVPAAVFI